MTTRALLVSLIALLSACGGTPDAPAAPAGSDAGADATVLTEVSQCEKHPISSVWKWTLANGQCTELVHQVNCRDGSSADATPTTTFDTVAACDAANGVTTSLAVVKLMTERGDIATADIARGRPTSCAALGFTAGAACRAEDYGLVCATDGDPASGIDLLACVLPLTSANSDPKYCDAPDPQVPYSYRCAGSSQSGGAVCYGVCIVDPKAATSPTTFGPRAQQSTCSPLTFCGDP